MEDLRVLWLIQKYLNLSSEDEWRSYGFRTTWAWVINDRIFIFGWTIPLICRSFMQYSDYFWPWFFMIPSTIHTSSWMSNSATGLVSRLRLGRTDSQKYVTKRVECTFFCRREEEKLIIMICMKKTGMLCTSTSATCSWKTGQTFQDGKHSWKH